LRTAFLCPIVAITCETCSPVLTKSPMLQKLFIRPRYHMEQLLTDQYQYHKKLDSFQSLTCCAISERPRQRGDSPVRQLCRGNDRVRPAKLPCLAPRASDSLTSFTSTYSPVRSSAQHANCQSFITHRRARRELCPDEL